MINRTWLRAYPIGSTLDGQSDRLLVCDTQLRNDRRIIYIGSIVRIYNRSTMPLLMLSPDSVQKKTYESIRRINVNDFSYVPLSLVYIENIQSVFFAVDQ